MLPFVISSSLWACATSHADRPVAATPGAAAIPVTAVPLDPLAPVGDPAGDVGSDLNPTGAPVVDPHSDGIVTYELRRGETLAHFARWSGLPVEAIADASGLPLDTPLPVGTIVRIPLDEDRRARVETNRDAHHVARADGWLASHGGEVGTAFYRVRTGDTAWTIAKGHGGLPVWVIETWNPAVDLEDLRPGQELMLPVLADAVEDSVPTVATRAE
ncbi:MAG: LysM peptidoglycan-binding domain-containing protein [Myxococcota bacterium]